MNDKIRKLELPAGARPEPMKCFFSVPVPQMSAHTGQVTGVGLAQAPCTPACALYDRVGGRPCLTALREDLVAAIRGSPVSGA